MPPEANIESRRAVRLIADERRALGRKHRGAGRRRDDDLVVGLYEHRGRLVILRVDGLIASPLPLKLVSSVPSASMRMTSTSLPPPASIDPTTTSFPSGCSATALNRIPVRPVMIMPVDANEVSSVPSGR
jgi:hypothetical protein